MTLWTHNVMCLVHHINFTISWCTTIIHAMWFRVRTYQHVAHHWYLTHNQCLSVVERELTNRKDARVCLLLSRFGCECEGELDTPCLLEPRCDTHKLSLVWIVLPFHFFAVKHTLDVLRLLCTWTINPDRCPTKNGATPGNQQQFIYAKLKTVISKSTLPWLYLFVVSCNTAFTRMLIDVCTCMRSATVCNMFMKDHNISVLNSY